MARGVTLLFVLSFSFVSIASAITLTDEATGLSVEAPNKKFRLINNNDGTYTVRKGKARARFVIGVSPFDARGTADDYIATTKAKTRRIRNQKGSVVVTLRRLGKQKNVQVRFRPTGVEGEMEITTYTGKVKKKKKKKGKKRLSRNSRLTAGAIAAFDRIIRSRQGGRRVQLPVNIPTRTLRGNDGTNAVVPNLPGWQTSAGGGIVSGENRAQGIFNLGVPTLVLFPGFFQGPVQNQAVPPGTAIAQVWPQQAAANGAPIQVLGVAQFPGTDGWLGPNFLSGLYAVRFAYAGRTWQGIMVSGVGTGVQGISWLWYHSFIAIPEVGGSQAIANALLNTWATWDNSAANLTRFRQALNTIATTVVPGNPIDPAVFDAINQEWLEYIRQ